MARVAALWTLPRVRVWLLVLLAVLSLGWTQDDHERAKRLKDAGKIIPLEKILPSGRAGQHGRLLDTITGHNSCCFALLAALF
jgi:hypothetical protein